MPAFLESIANHIHRNYSGKTGSLCLVTPNRRSGVFFRKYFSKGVKQTMWAPEVMSVEDFINSISQLSIPDNTSLLLKFYTIYRELEQEKADPPEVFLQWAPGLMRDFDEMDAHMVSSEALFGYLQDVKYIESWNPEGQSLTRGQEEYLAFFGKLRLYHQKFTDYLLENSLAYQGLSAGMAARRIESASFLLPWEKVIFAGFNALTKAEEVIIDHLIREGIAEYHPDADQWYANNPEQEAGRFVSAYMKRWKAFPEKAENYFGEENKSIRIFGIAKNVNQARLAGNLIEQYNLDTGSERTAIVLANESLLVPVLNALPNPGTGINVTMGYPLMQSGLFSFFDALFQALQYTAKAGKTGESGVFYHKDLIRFFSYDAAALLWDVEKGKEYCTQLIDKLNKGSSSFLGYEKLSDPDFSPAGFTESFHFLGNNWQKQTAGLLETLVNITQKLSQAFREKAALHGGNILQTPFFLDFEALWYMSALFRKMQGFAQKHPGFDTLVSVYTLFRRLASETRIAFTGEPLEGLQVMGMLETRNLDFENVIILSANEDLLPRGKGASSMIPFQVRLNFGLPVHTHRDATYAYHFYRLIQRARNVFLIYNTETDGIGSGEKSRFIRQLQVEIPKAFPNINIEEHLITLPSPKGHQPEPIEIRKTPEIMERLLEISRRGFSPSALSKYIGCPLKFYLERVAGIQEEDEIEETLETATQGTVIHESLNLLYQPHLGKTLTAENIREIKKQYRKTLFEQYARNYPGGEINRGMNLLLTELSAKYIENFLDQELSHLQELQKGGNQLRLLALEQRMQAFVDVAIEGAAVQVKISGVADRIDRIEGPDEHIRIVDYKTGSVKESELSLGSWDDLCTKGSNGKAFQLLCYSLMYAEESSHGREWCEAGIISLKKISRWFMPVKTPQHPEDLSSREAFVSCLKTLIEEILNKDIAFTQTQDEDNCRYCPFTGLCQREPAANNY